MTTYHTRNQVRLRLRQMVPRCPKGVAELASDFGVSAVFMRNVLNGHKQPTKKMLRRLGYDTEARYRLLDMPHTEVRYKLMEDSR